MKTIEEMLKGCEHDGSMIPVNEVKRLMKEYAREAIAEHEREMFKPASEKDKASGWTLDFSLLQKIADRASDFIDEDGCSYSVGMEETEAVLIAFRDRDKELPAPYQETPPAKFNDTTSRPYQEGGRE